MAGSVHLRRRLGEREIAGPKPRLRLRPKKLAHEIFDSALEIAKGNVGIDGQPLHCIESWCPCEYQHADYFSHIAPKAGAIAWAGLRNGGNSAAMAEELRVKKSVLLVAGEQMGMNSFVRFGFGGDPAHLQNALSRISDWMQDGRR